VSNDTLDEVLLRVPARPEYGRIVRVGAAALAMRVGLSFGEIDELRLAIDETMVLLISAADIDTEISVAFRFDGTSLVLEAECETSGGLLGDTIGRFVEIVEGLVTKYEIDSERGRLLLRKTAAEA